MAIFSTLNLSLKVLVASTCVFSLAAAAKLSLPAVQTFFVSKLPSLYALLLPWLKPPCIYLLINFIIISIVASSKLQLKTVDTNVETVEDGGVVLTEDEERLWQSDNDVYRKVDASVLDSEETTMTKQEKKIKKKKNKVVEVDEVEVVKRVDEVVFSRSANVRVPAPNESMEFVFEKLNPVEGETPPASSRFARKAIKSCPDGGKALGVSKPKRHDTLESTWKTITDGRAMPLNRHLKKSETWDSYTRQNDENTPPRMQKAETFNYGQSALSPSSGSAKLRREPSLSQDELNRRVEAFINKFNQQMRLQRQDSFNRYQEMLRRGV